MKSLRVVFLVVLLQLCLPGGTFAAATQGNEPGSPPPLRVYTPVPGTTSGPAGFNKAISQLQQLFPTLPMDVRLELVPVRRAIQQFETLPEVCIYDLRGRLSNHAGPEVLSRQLSVSRFWLYVLAEVHASPSSQQRRIGTIIGAELFFDLGQLEAAEWVFASSYQGLISMLLSGRVDAVTLGPGNSLDYDTLPENIVRATEEPFLSLSGMIRCKESARTKAFISALDAAWENTIENN
ncbi:MAG: hypothetical protein HWE25_03005 [Alphaproteobacteria bacterium]|nr:hypothetical protein [Alphaproteobacteria bacterium]